MPQGQGHLLSEVPRGHRHRVCDLLSRKLILNLILSVRGRHGNIDVCIDVCRKLVGMVHDVIDDDSISCVVVCARLSAGIERCQGRWGADCSGELRNADSCARREWLVRLFMPDRVLPMPGVRQRGRSADGSGQSLHQRFGRRRRVDLVVGR